MHCVRKNDVEALLRAHGMDPVSITLKGTNGQQPSSLSVTLECEASANRLYRALRASTKWDVGKGRDEAGHFVVTMFGCSRYQ